MNTALRYFLLVFVTVITLHSILSFTHTEYGRVTSLSNIADHWSPATTEPVFNAAPDAYYLPPTTDSNGTSVKPDELLVRRANATFVILARNSDMNGVLKSVRENEERFNRKYNYPYVFLNEEPFTDEFKERIGVLSAASMEFGLIEHDDWFQPDWIDETKAKAGRDQMVADNVIYGGSVSYRNMCRYNSGFFFRHALLQKYRWYWRIEPDVHFHCDVAYDPFLYMQDNDKRYGFTITMYEYERTIPTLWGHVKDFIKAHPEHVAADNAMGYLSDNGGERYNLCHFWSNFEIGSLTWLRSKAYTDFFESLDQDGGFFYERWGDAPVHSIAAGLLLNKDEIHFFNDIAYFHVPFTHCPTGEKTRLDLRCHCNPKDNFDWKGYSCTSRFFDLNGMDKPEGWENQQD